MASAFTTLPDSRVIRWHADLTECDRPECPERHLSKAELFADLDGMDVRARDFDRGKDHR